MLKSVFMDSLIDTSLLAKHAFGALRVEHDDKFGERWFRYCQNKSGGNLAVDTLTMYDGSIISPIAASAGGVNYVARASGSFITDKVVAGDIIYVVDDAGAAGAAPEGETSFVTAVSALRVDFLPALSAALVATDTVSFLKKWTLIASAAKAGKRVAGIPMVDIADGYCGWIQTRGIYPSANVIASGTALLEGDRLAAGTAILTLLPTLAVNDAGTGDVNEVAVATVLQPLTSDTVRRKAVVMLDLI